MPYAGNNTVVKWVRHNKCMHYTPSAASPPVAAAVFTRAADAVQHLKTLYQQQIAHLRSAMQTYVEGQDFAHPVRA